MLMFILGFCVMSAFAFAAAFAFDDGKDTLGCVFSGPVMWFWLIVVGSGFKLYRRLKLCHFSKNYHVVRFYIDDILYDTYYIHTAALDQFKISENSNGQKYWVKLIKSCSDAKSLPFKQYVFGKDGKQKELTSDFVNNWRKGN